MKESIKKAAAMLLPKMKIIVLNPNFSAPFTPKESTEAVITANIGNTIDMKFKVTSGLYYFM
jgi:hypothetical protein